MSVSPTLDHPGSSGSSGSTTSTTSVALHPLVAERFSPRAYAADARLSDSELLALLEAARWAPSRSNGQKRHFLAGRRGDATFAGLLLSLRPSNQAWAGAASALVAGVVPVADDEGASDRLSAYDLGLAVGQLVVQASALGLHVRQMAGFDAAHAEAEFEVPTDHQVLVILAIGTRGEVESLPQDLQSKERAPRERRPLDELAFTGSWGEPLRLTP